MTPTIRAVAFDLDGLIFDTEALFFRIASEMLNARGKTFTKEIMAAMIGRQAAIAYPAMKEMAGLEETVDELLVEARERFFALIDTAVHPTPGLFLLLRHLETIGIPRAVCTSSRRTYAERLLGNHGLSHHFTFLLCAEDVTHSKPSPEIYLTAATRFGVLPGELMVLEDSPAGLMAAKAAGAFAVAIPHEHSPGQALELADVIATRLDDPGVLSLLIKA